MWLIIFIAALIVFIWFTEPKPEQLTVRSGDAPNANHEGETPAGGISRLLDS